MKKIEAQRLSKDRARLIIEYIAQIISFNDSATITLDICKVEEGSMCAIRIENTAATFKKYLNTGIPTIHKAVFFSETLNCLADNFLDRKEFDISRFSDIEGLPSLRFSGVEINNKAEAVVKVNFIGASGMKDLASTIKEYNQRIDNYTNNLENKRKNH